MARKDPRADDALATPSSSPGLLSVVHIASVRPSPHCPHGLTGGGAASFAASVAIGSGVGGVCGLARCV